MMYSAALIKIKEDFVMEIKLNLPGWKIGPDSEFVYLTIEKGVAELS